MANWTVNTNTFTALASASVSNQIVNLTISPVGNYIVSAANFKIGGATETSSGSGVWEGGNVDSGVVSVTFTNNTSVIDGNNTVNAAVKITDSDVGTSNATYNVDIDEISTNPPIDYVLRPFCARICWDYFYNGLGSVMNVDTTTINDVVVIDPAFQAYAIESYYGNTPVNWPADGVAQVKTSGNVPSGQWSVIARFTFTAGSNNYFSEAGTGYLNPVYQGQYFNNYDTETHSVVTNSSGNVTSFVIDILYYPPEDAPLFPDPVDMCALNHKFTLDYTLVVVDNTDPSLGDTI